MGSFYDISNYTTALENKLTQNYNETEKQVSKSYEEAKKFASDKVDEVKKTADDTYQQGKALLNFVETGLKSEAKSLAASSTQTLENYKKAAKATYTAYAEPVKAIASQSTSTVSIQKPFLPSAMANMSAPHTTDSEPGGSTDIEITNPIKFVQNVADNFSYTGLLEYELSGLEAGAAVLQAPYMQEVENGNYSALNSPHLQLGIAAYTGVQFVKAFAGGIGAMAGTNKFIKALPDAGLEYLSDSILNQELGDPMLALEKTSHYGDARATFDFVGQLAKLSQKGKVINEEAFNTALTKTRENQKPESDVLHDFAVYYSAEIILDGIEGAQMGAQVFLGDNPELPWYLRAQNMTGSVLAIVAPTALEIKGGGVLKEVSREMTSKTPQTILTKLPEPEPIIIAEIAPKEIVLSSIDSKLFSETTQLCDEVTDVGTEPTVKLIRATEKTTPWLSQSEFSVAVEQMTLRLDELGSQLQENWTSRLAEQKRRITHIEGEIKGHSELLGWIEKNSDNLSELSSLIQKAKNKIESLDPSVTEKKVELKTKQENHEIEIKNELKILMEQT